MSGMCRQQKDADVSGLVCSEWELLILLPCCLPGSRLLWSPLTQQPGAGEVPAWFLLSTVPSLSPCPQLLSLLANRVLGVGVEDSGMLLARVWSDCSSDRDQGTCMYGFGDPSSEPWSPQPHTWSVGMCPTLADTGPACVPQWSNFSYSTKCKVRRWHCLWLQMVGDIFLLQEYKQGQHSGLGM